MSHDNPTPPASELTRRVVLRGAAVTGVAVPLLVACGADEGPAGTSTSDTPKAGGPLASTADVPVGEGTILKEDQIVLTQPTEGEFKAFTAICTHQGCTVSSVSNGKISCACHGSQFSVRDGSNVTGPSGSAAGSVADLEEIPIKVEGSQIVKG